MKNKKVILLSLVIIIIIGISAFFTYNHFKKDIMKCPFSALTWDDTIEDMVNYEGENYTTYDSVYNGQTYTYDKSYLNTNGRIKYMYDEKENLRCIAWTCSGTDYDSLSQLYDKINNEITKHYGKSDNDSDGINNSGDVWHLKTGDIVLTFMNTDSNKAIQYAFLSPETSD